MPKSTRDALKREYHPENEKEARVLFYSARNIVKCMIYDIVNHFKNSETTKNHLIIFNFHNAAALCLDMRCNYIRCFSVWAKDYGREKMTMYLHAYHDSCWTEGVEEFLAVLFTEIKRIEAIDWEDNYEDKPTLDLPKFAIRDLDRIPEEVREAINRLDYEHTGSRNKEIVELDYCYEMFPL